MDDKYKWFCVRLFYARLLGDSEGIVKILDEIAKEIRAEEKEGG